MADQGSNYVLRAFELFERYGDQEAIVWQDQRLSYANLISMTLNLRAGLREHGVEPGSAVALLVPDHPEAPALQFALHLLGCQAIWIASYAPPAAQLEYIELAKPDVLIYHPAMLPASSSVAELALGSALRALSVSSPGGGEADLVPGLSPAAAVSPAAAGPDGIAGLDGMVAGPSPQTLFYTGGTTGTPKLVRHTQHFYDVMLAIAAFYVASGEPPMRFLNGSSFSHVSGQLSGFLTLFEGGTLFLGQNSSTAEFLATIEREKVSSTFLTPALLYELIDDPLTAATDTSSLRYLNVGGGPASPARLAQAIDLLGPVVRLVYGSSEAPLICDLPFLDHEPEHPERLRSCGTPFADARIEIRDPDGGSPLPADEAGEVWVTGSLLMSEYWTQPELTAHALSDGWLRTGDIGYVDEHGYLYLVDRMNDMIVTSSAAANVYARPIEDALASHPQVKTAAVVAMPDEAIGEAVHAFVVTVPGAEVTADELRAVVREQLNNLYTPRGITFVDRLPLTPLGKVDKKRLRQGPA
jgi:acyl-CoA synthetase (AMP-forming)/AMP-acid ligase II